MLARLTRENLLSFGECFGGLSLATANESKRAEYRAMFAGQKISIVHLDIPPPFMSDIERRQWNHLMAEGEYQKLAEILATEKAEQAYFHNGQRPIVVEQSLLFIPHLDGWPGPDIVDLDSDAARKVLIEHAYQDRGAGDPGRVVVFTTLAVYTPDRGVQLRHGRIEGEIAHSSRGSSGFAWDPIVQPILDGKLYPRTFAEMNINEKNRCSMRYQAILALQREPFVAPGLQS